MTERQRELQEALRAAWEWRNARGFEKDTEALRVFHGPGEGGSAFKSFSIDCFGETAWVSFWGEQAPDLREGISQFLRSVGIRAAVYQGRPEKGGPGVSEELFGKVPADPFLVREGGARFWIRLKEVRHPGLFLDHAPLRSWLGRHSSGLKVLNTFAYTGSLSVAAALGGAAEVVTLDLSKATVRWAEENARANQEGAPSTRQEFIAGDVFEWLPRFKREGRVFDAVILDPPSFSRGKKGEFSTSKDLIKLHELALALLAPGGYLITSINSAKIPRAKFESEVYGALKQRRALILSRIELPETFPTRPGDEEERYLKGLLLKV